MVKCAVIEFVIPNLSRIFYLYIQELLDHAALKPILTTIHNAYFLVEKQLSNNGIKAFLLIKYLVCINLMMKSVR